MKKLMVFLICLFSLCFINVNAFEIPELTDHEKVNIYVFRGSGCSHCYDALDYFNNVMTNNPELENYINFVFYETWEDYDNYILSEKVATDFGDVGSAVPYIVIGDSYHMAGFATSIGDEIIQTALNEYSNPYYYDVVSIILSDGYDDAVSETLYEALVDEGIIIVDNDDEEECDCDCYDDDFDIFEDEEEDFFALGVVSFLFFISFIINCNLLPLAIVFIILFIKEKKKNKQNNKDKKTL